MSIISKISMFLISIVILIYISVQSFALFELVNFSKNELVKFDIICFIFFVPLFSAIIGQIIHKNKINYKLNQYTSRLNEVLIKQSHNSLFYEGQVSAGAKELTREIANSICTDRCSVWLYNEDKSSIICQQLYVKSEDNWYQDIELFEKDFLPYFNELKNDDVIVADDAEKHPATTCFLNNYLRPLGIKSMLDVPIMYRGQVIGVFCIESLTKRKWISTEISFARLVSSLYSFAYSIKDGNRKERRITETEQFISKAALISITDKDGKIVFVNEKFSEVSGWSLEDAYGKDHNIVNSGHHTKDFWKEMYQTILNGQIWNKVITNRKKNGELYYVDSYIRARFDDNGKLEGFASIRHDVTELKLKEQEIANQISAINKSNALVEFDLNGVILFANNKFLETMGYDYCKNGGLEEIVGKHHSIFITDDQSKTQEYLDFWSDLKEGKFMSAEFQRIKKDGTIVWLRATYNPILDINGKVYKVMKLAVDITESVQQKEEIEKKNTYLEHAAKILRHDMHSGINTYIPRGISSLERRLTDEDIRNLKIEAPLKMIKEGLKHTQKVYKGVYEFTNLVKREVVITKAECDIKHILSDYLSSTSYKSQVILDDSLPTISVNEPLFCTAIDNLIRNGLKYNDSSNKFVKIYYVTEKNYLIVEDNGRGMSQEDFEHLSKPYVRKEGQKESGSGLGLNICKAILHEHGFKITAKKLKEGGTKLKIKII